MKTNFLVFIVVLFTFSACAQQYKNFDEMATDMAKGSAKKINTHQLDSLLKIKKINLIDVRESVEFKVSHIKGAKNDAYNNFKVKSLKNINKQDTIIIYCSVGYRSEKVAEKLQKAGYKNIFNLYGGIFDWINKGLAVYNMNNNVTKKIHPYNKSWGKWLSKGEKVNE